MTSLKAENLSVVYPASGASQAVAALKQVSFEVKPGEILGVVGESGSGKSTLALSLMGLLPAGCQLTADRLELDSVTLLNRSPADWQRIRGHQLSMVFQEATSALDPVFQVGHQLQSVTRRLSGISGQQARSKTLESLASVGFEDPESIYSRYPGELSGGMNQRVLIAMALAGNPKILIADEPSSALDVSIQAQVLELLCERKDQQGFGMILISHDLGIIAQYCDKALVVQEGSVVEQADVRELFEAPRAEYTRRLLAAVPRLDS